MAKSDKMFMDIAVRTAEESNCVKYHVGCVIVKDGRIILQGYNGTVSGFINCDEKFKDVKMDIPYFRKEHREWSSAVELHAEMNIITYSARKGIALEGTTMYCTLQPCNNCLKHIVSAGIKKVVYMTEKEDDNKQEDIEILKKRIEIVKYKDE